MADDGHRAARAATDAGHDRRVVAVEAVAVQLLEVRPEARDVVERVGPVLVAGELDRLPDRRAGLGLAGEPVGEAAHEAPPAAGGDAHGSPPSSSSSSAGRRGFALATRRRDSSGQALGDLGGPLGAGLGPGHRRRRVEAGRPLEDAQHLGDARGQVATVHDRVNLPLGELGLGPAEVVGQALAGGLLDDARAREGDQRPRLGVGDVAERGERRPDAARWWGAPARPGSAARRRASPRRRPPSWPSASGRGRPPASARRPTP